MSAETGGSEDWVNGGLGEPKESKNREFFFPSYFIPFVLSENIILCKKCLDNFYYTLEVKFILSLTLAYLYMVCVCVVYFSLLVFPIFPFFIIII